MSKIDELIQEYCPEGVEFKMIKDVYLRIKGTPITASKMKEISNPDGDVKIFAGGKTVIDAFESNIPNANITRVPAVLVQSRGVIDAVYYDKPFTFKNEMWAYTAESKESVKYLYYVLKDNVKYFRDAASGMGSLPQISLKVTEDFKIPVPPLEVQKEIVKILDTFTQLEAELTAELTARKAQYEHYRNQLLTFDDAGGVRWTTLGEVAMVKSGKNKSRSPEGRYPVYGSTGTIGHSDSYVYDDSLLLVARVGAYAGLVNKVSGKFDVSDNTLMIKLNDEVNMDYFYYLLVSMNLNQYATGGGQPLVTAGKLKDLPVPLPSSEEQKRIAAVLGKFDALTNDISQGLPAEITARQKQYEYYRTKLLTFKELSA
ncbi:MAG: restriction endonuclease subunit S [Candidatus Microsaccharimonas sp.]